jgi:hypothetical protein
MGASSPQRAAIFGSPRNRRPSAASPICLASDQFGRIILKDMHATDNSIYLQDKIAARGRGQHRRVIGESEGSWMPHKRAKIFCDEAILAGIEQLLLYHRKQSPDKL